MKIIMNLVLTIAIGSKYREISKLTNESIKNYAKKIGADFKCIDRQEISKTTPHWEKFQISSLLDEYDRILYVDSDIIIRDDAPNLFEIVPNGLLGMFNEAKFTDRSKELMIDICKKYGETLRSWDGRYFNSGVMVISQNHRDLFTKPTEEIFSFYEQSYLNMVIARDNIDMFELDYRFNRMTCVDRYTGEDRHASYFIHYAGYPSASGLENIIKDDLKKWKSGFRGNGRHVYISVNGGLGDQMCAEPAIRWMKENLYPKDEMIVASHWPRLFEHFKDIGIDVCEHGKSKLKPDTPYFLVTTLPGPDTIQWSIVSHLLCNTTDYVSMSIMHRILPMKDKTIKFKVFDKDRKTIKKYLGDDWFDYVVVHPGKHWDSKTFPSKYWQDIIDGLIKNGERVCIIGKEERGDPPDYKAGARGTVDVDASNCIDLRNKLNLGELGALFEKAKCLISNDSAPIHLAGAFDIEIILLPSCKNPDHVLPYRNGSIYYKTKTFYKNLPIDDVESRPTQISPTEAGSIKRQWIDYLEDPQKIIDYICL